MVHRDPETGQFLPGHDDVWDDIEVATARASFGVQAADLTGATSFIGGDVFTYEGLELIDYDEIVDRNEALHLLSANHLLVAYVNSTETADGTVIISAEVSADPAQVPASATGPGTDSFDDSDAVGFAAMDDSIDLVGRPLAAVGHAPFSDGATGVGGGGSAGEDSYVMASFPAEFGRFHPRDELFVNGQIRAWNIDDAGVHGQVNIQHVYGVIED